MTPYRTFWQYLFNSGGIFNSLGPYLIMFIIFGSLAYADDATPMVYFMAICFTIASAVGFGDYKKNG